MFQDDDQHWVCDPQTLQGMTTNFFSKLYTSAGSRDYGPLLDQCQQVVTSEMNEQLVSMVTIEEVRRATFQLGTTKAPGPDGLNGLFNQKHWEIIKADLLLLVLHFFMSGEMPPSLNHTFLALIPKTPHPKKLEQYHPINLYNFAYKIISKVLANRLKP